MAVLKAHKEDQFLADPNHYGKESPIIMNLVLVRNKYGNKMWNWKSIGDIFTRKL
jgi:hypothetical protein